MLTTGRMPIDHPKQRTARRPTGYSQQQIDAIVDYTSTFDSSGPEIPEVDLDGELTRGLVLYQENCAACHSTTGIGGALTPSRRRERGSLTAASSLVAPGLESASPIEIAEATRTGPGTMPVFGEETINEGDLSAIVRYALYLQDPDDSGGAPIGRVGPVVEGAIGWILGAGLLLIFIRWIGTKRGEL
jgi:ubiquinol-cytochrome c reductase cytochrome c subunit